MRITINHFDNEYEGMRLLINAIHNIDHTIPVIIIGKTANEAEIIAHKKASGLVMIGHARQSIAMESIFKDPELMDILVKNNPQSHGMRIGMVKDEPLIVKSIEITARPELDDPIINIRDRPQPMGPTHRDKRPGKNKYPRRR